MNLLGGIHVLIFMVHWTIPRFLNRSVFQLLYVIDQLYLILLIIVICVCSTRNKGNMTSFHFYITTKHYYSLTCVQCLLKKLTLILKISPRIPKYYLFILSCFLIRSVYAIHFEYVVITF